MLKNIFFKIISFTLNLTVPKDKNLILFGGRQFGGNTGALFLYWQNHYLQKKTSIRPVWITSREEVLRSGIQDSVAGNSWNGVFLASRAMAVCLTHSLGDFSPVQFPSKKVKLFNLWHGMPIKRISTADPQFYSRRYARSNLREMKRFCAMFVTSPKMVDIFSSTFLLSPEKIHITGQPRTDELFHCPTSIDDRFAPPLPPHSRKILHCPTWREGEAVELFPFEDFDVEILQTRLESLDALMFIRTHPNDPGRLKERDRRLIPLQADVLPDITGFLPIFDVLITDYSSVYYDYLLLNRPTVFLPYDLEKYEAMPGFYIPFAEIAAGDIARTGEEFLGALESAIVNPEKDESFRGQIQRMVYRFTDDKASQRVFDCICQFLI